MSLSAGELITDTLPYDGGRPVTAYLPHRQVRTVVYTADGGWHVEPLAHALERAGAATTLIVGPHGRDSDDERLQEYIPGIDDQRFAAHEQFFVEEVGRWTATRFELALPPGRIAVWGASRGAELALALGLRHPDLYGTVLAASPGAGYGPPALWPSPLPRFYLVAGLQEPFFLDNAKRWADALGRAEADAVMLERSGEHGGAFWAEEFPLMVAWAFRP